jgi:hypothetical protein
MIRVRLGSGSNISLLLKVAVTAGLLLAIAHGRINFHQIRDTIGNAKPATLSLAAAVLVASYVIGGLRWWCVVRGLGDRASVQRLIGLFSLGGLVGQFLPNPLGDAVRVAIAAKQGMRVGLAIRSAFFERVIMVMALLVLVAATEDLLRARLGSMAPAGAAWLLLAAGCLGLVALSIADRIIDPARMVPLARGVVESSAEFRRLLMSPWSLGVYGLALLGHLNLFISAAIVGAALSLPLGFQDYLAIMPLATIAMVLPVSIGGWGVREGVLVAVMAKLGVTVETALAFSVLFGLCVAVSSLPAIGFLWMVRGTSGMGAQKYARPRPSTRMTVSPR